MGFGSRSGCCPRALLPSGGLGGGRTRCHGAATVMPGHSDTARWGRDGSWQRLEGGEEAGRQELGQAAITLPQGGSSATGFPPEESSACILHASVGLSSFLLPARRPQGRMVGGSCPVAGEVPAWLWPFYGVGATGQTVPQFPPLQQSGEGGCQGS